MEPIKIELDVSITAPVLAEVLWQLACACNNLTASRVPAAQQATTEPPAAAAQTKPEPESEPESGDDETAYTVEDVRAAMRTLSKNKGNDTAKAILAKLGVKSVSNLKPEQRVAARKMIEEAK